MDSMQLAWLFGLIAFVEFIIIVHIRTREVPQPFKVRGGVKQPTIEYELQQIDRWTELYFNNHHHSKKEIGKMYERYIGYLKEQEGYAVNYCGLRFSYKDSGIDLICRKSDEILLVQCKRLTHLKEIHEDVINKLRGSLEQFKAKNHVENVKAEVCSTANFAEDAIAAAKIHNIGTLVIPFNKDYPSLKCNISHGQKHIFAPFHPAYDKISIDTKTGEFYCRRAEEGFRQGFLPAKIPWKYIWAARKKVGLLRKHY